MHWAPGHLPTRRELLAGALSAAAAGSFAAAALDASAADAAAESDSDLLHAILSVELLLVFCYQQVLQSETLAPEAVPAIRHILGQEQTHIDVMSDEAARFGQLPPSAPSSVSAADDELDALHASGSISSLHSQQDCLRLLEGVEELAQGAYYQSITKLTDPRLARVCASILGAEGQHYAVLGDLLHPGEIDKAVPNAFVQGRS
jgi:ferritin-like protein